MYSFSLGVPMRFAQAYFCDAADEGVTSAAVESTGDEARIADSSNTHDTQGNKSFSLIAFIQEHCT